MVQGVARPVEELASIEDCTEEIIFIFMDAFTNAGTSPAEVGQRRYDLPDKIEAILLRARSVPLKTLPVVNT